MFIIKKYELNFYLRKFLLLFIILFIFYRITDGSEKILSLINYINYQYLIATCVSVFFLLIASIYINLIIYNKFQNNKIETYFFFNNYIKSQIFSYIYILVGVIYRYYGFKKKIPLISFININIFIFWFFLFFYLILYSFEIFFFGFTFYPLNIYVFFFLILIAFSIFALPKIFKLNYRLINKLKYLIKKKINFRDLDIKISKFYSYLSINFFSLGLLNHLLSFLQIFFLFKMLNIPIEFYQIVILFVLNSILDQFPFLTPKNIGISEIIFGYLAQVGGFSFDNGVLLKFILRFLSFIFLIITYFFLNYKNIFRIICKLFK